MIAQVPCPARPRVSARAIFLLTCAIALVIAGFSAPKVAHAQSPAVTYVATSTITSGGKYVLVSNVTNDPITTTHNKLPTVLGPVGMNSSMIGSQAFTITGRALRPNTNLIPWEFTITSAGVSDGGNPGYRIRIGGSDLSVTQGLSGVTQYEADPYVIGSTSVHYREFVSDPYCAFSGTPCVWFWDGSRFYTRYTSDMTSVGGYHKAVNPGDWAGYYTSNSEVGWAWVDWSTPPWGHGGTLPDGSQEWGAQYINMKFYLMGMRPGLDKVFPPGFFTPGTPMGDVTFDQLYFGNNLGVGVSAMRDPYTSPGMYDLYPSGFESSDVTLYLSYTDNSGPVISGVPADKIAEATSPSGAAVTWTAPTADDAVDGARTVTCSPSSGSTFALGDTTVTVSASDSQGNTTTRYFKVTVRDTTPPVITAPGTKYVDATGPDGAVATWSAVTVTDAVNTTVTAVCTPASGSTFPIGDSVVSISATDLAGNHSSASFHVVVRDTIAPEIENVPADKVVEATGPGGAVVTWPAPEANDDGGGDVDVVCVPASGSLFALGETTVTVTATDSNDNSAMATFKVTVRDTTAPELDSVPADKVVEATGPDGAVVTWPAPSATDVVDGSVTPALTHASGETFPLGDTTVTVTATDAHGNVASDSFKVTVRDTTAPVIAGIPADLVLEASGPAGAEATWTAPTAMDLVDGAVTPAVSPASGDTFPLGETVVSISATDAAGNVASASFKVTVRDNTAPTLLGVPADKTVPASGPYGAVVTWPMPTATDGVDGALSTICSPSSGTTFPVGVTVVTCTATDSAGNVVTKTFKITVSPWKLHKFATVWFAFDKPQLTAGAKRTLDGLAASIVANHFTTADVRGFTSAQKGGGSWASRIKLSAARAKAVRNYLASKLAAMGYRVSITSSGRGPASPIASNKTEAGRRKNRRVEIWAK